MSHDFLFKFILVGDSSVGKTALLERFTNANFQSTSVYEATVGVDFKTKNVTIDGKEVMIMTWDTAGQETYRSVTRSYYRGTAVALLIYDIGDKESFANIPTWLEDVKNHSDNPNLTLVLVGNKKDAENTRQVDTEQGQALASQYDILFFESSAKTGENVQQLFNSAARQFYKKFKDGFVDFTSDSQGLTLGPKQLNSRGSGRCACW